MVFLITFKAIKLLRQNCVLWDIMIIHNWTVHSTYITNEMTQSFEFRIKDKQSKSLLPGKYLNNISENNLFNLN